MDQKAAVENGTTEHQSARTRLLKLFLTDGLRSIVAFEEHVIAPLSVKTPAGGKVQHAIEVPKNVVE